MAKKDPIAEMLQIWGLMAAGGTLKAAGIHEANGESADDWQENVAICQHVESCPTFTVCRPVLIHVYGLGERPGSLIWQNIGETRTEALRRLKWHDLEGVVNRDIPDAVLSGFIHTFRRWDALNPMKPMYRGLLDYSAPPVPEPVKKK
jgi:hypothetical protein